MSEKNHISVFFRYDDFAATSPFDLEKRIADVFGRGGVSFTVGIIPYITKGDIHDPRNFGNAELPFEKVNFINYMVKSHVIDPALHGYEHKNSRIGSPYSEFRGLEYNVQYQKLLRGAELFEQQFGIWPQSFIPPWNSYDRNTLKVLERIKIKNVSANRYGDANNSNLKYLPVTVSFVDLPAALRSARYLNCENIVIGVLLHSYDFIESGDNRSYISINDFQKVVKGMENTPNVSIFSADQILRQEYDFNGYRCRANKLPKINSFIPPYVDNFSYLLYLPAKDAIRKKFCNWIHTVLFYTFSATLIVAAGYIMHQIFSGMWLGYLYLIRFSTVGSLIAIGKRAYTKKNRKRYKAVLLGFVLIGLIISSL